MRSLFFQHGASRALPRFRCASRGLAALLCLQLISTAARADGGGSASSVPAGASAAAKPVLPGNSAQAESAPAAAERGFRYLREKPFLPPDFDDEVFDALWKVWPEPLRSRAESASPAERREMAFARYGLIPTLDNDQTPAAAPRQSTPLGYVSTPNGWVMNCLACHGGKVAGQVIPGLPNSHFDLQTLTEETRLTKLILKRPLAHLETGSLVMPLGANAGTTNAVMFGVVLGHLRDEHMHVHKDRGMPLVTHHDMDAVPFWNVKKKKSLYCDGFAPVNHRVLMQFVLIPANTRERLDLWEQPFRDILAWIKSLEPPPYPWEIDSQLAESGRTVFEANCAQCHGTYGKSDEYDQQTIPLDVVGTDPVRFHALTREHRRWMQAGWLSDYGADHVELEPVGYVAPPLDGIWASAPYFHNGSVPTLWHVLHPDQRPVVWTRATLDGYDRGRTGLDVVEREDVPEGITDPAERRRHFDTRAFGKSAAGHLFPNGLTEAEKRAVLEYLKTL